MPAVYSAAELNSALQGRQARLNGGFLDLLDAGGAIVARATFDSPCGVVVASTLTFSGFPKTVTPAQTGVAIASARLRYASNTDAATGFTVGLAGSGAQVIVSKMTPSSGDTVTVLAGPTLTDA